MKNLNEGDNDREPNDSGVVLWDGYLLDDELCRLVARFGKNTKNLFMFAECYSGGVLDLKFALKADGGCQRMKKIREVKSRTVLVSAVDSSQISWVLPSGTYFARGIANSINSNDCDEISFTGLVQKLREYCPKQNCSISASFKLDEDDMLYEKRKFTWIKTTKKHFS